MLTKKKFEKIKKGFSLAELLVSITLIMVLSFIIYSNFYKRSGVSVLQSATRQIISLLTEARSRAISQDRDSSWGVYFENSSTQPFYALFYSNYSTSTTVKKYNLPLFVIYNTSSIPVGGSIKVNFSKLYGNVTITTSSEQYSTSSMVLYLNLLKNNQILATSSILIYSTGLIDYNF